MERKCFFFKRSLNESIFVSGWIFKLKLSNPEELKSLMNESAYGEFLKDAAH